MRSIVYLFVCLFECQTLARIWESIFQFDKMIFNFVLFAVHATMVQVRAFFHFASQIKWYKWYV